MAAKKMSKADIKLVRRIEKKVIEEMLKLLDKKRPVRKPVQKAVRAKRKKAVARSTRKMVKKAARQVVRKTAARIARKVSRGRKRR